MKMNALVDSRDSGFAEYLPSATCARPRKHLSCNRQLTTLFPPNPKRSAHPRTVFPGKYPVNSD